MICPVLKDQDFLNDVAICRRDTAQFYLWWLGQSGFLIQWQGRHLLIDPYLSDSLTHKYAQTDKPHIRMTERVISPGALDFIDVVTSSHNHTDHLDAETLNPLLRVNPTIKLVIPEGNREFVCRRLGIATTFPLGLDAGQTSTVAGFKITALPAAHQTIEKDAAGRCHYLGYLVQLGKWTIYHSGDSVVYPGLVDNLHARQIDLALLPINGAKPERRVAGNMNGPEAANLAKDVGCKLAIPCHYEMFEFNTETPDAFVAAAKSRNQTVRVLKAGERWSSRELGEEQNVETHLK